MDYLQYLCGGNALYTYMVEIGVCMMYAAWRARLINANHGRMASLSI